jgi:hypothetical protein
MSLEACSEAPATWLDRLCAFRRARQRAGRRFKLHGGRRDIGDDGADRRLELVGETNEFGAARGAAGLVLRLLRRRIPFGLGDRLHLELFDRSRHFADLVLAAETWEHDVEIAAGELAHCLAHRDHRPRDAAAEQQRQHRTEQKAARRKHHDQMFGIDNRRIRFRFKPLLVGDQIGLHRASAFHDGFGRFAYFGGQVRDRLRIFDQFGQGIAVFVKQPGKLLQRQPDLFVGR